MVARTIRSILDGSLTHSAFDYRDRAQIKGPPSGSRRSFVVWVRYTLGVPWRNTSLQCLGLRSRMHSWRATATDAAAGAVYVEPSDHRPVCNRATGLVREMNRIMEIGKPSLRSLVPLAVAFDGTGGAAGNRTGSWFRKRAGHTLVQGCHVIEREPRAATADGVPSFPAIAAKPDTTAVSIARY